MVLLKTYARPVIPNIHWEMREVDYMSLQMKEYTSLRVYVIQMEGVLNKYQNQSEVVDGE